MKFIKSRDRFLREAKIGDVILPRQAEEVAEYWGKSYLDLEEIEPTSKIKQGSWVLSESDKNKVLSAFFGVDMEILMTKFESLSENFCRILKESLDVSLLSNLPERLAYLASKFDIRKPSVDDMYILYENIFRKLSVGETKAAEVVKRDEGGRPVLDDSGKMIKIQKEIGEPVFTKNLVSIISFIDDFNNCYPGDSVPKEMFTTGSVYNIRNKAGEDMSGGEYEVDFEIFSKDLFLSIQHKPEDILNISISKFYASCQDLYSGDYREQLLANVFDPNSIPAFLRFEGTIYKQGEKISNYIPISRLMIRNIERFDQDIVLFFDDSYPHRMWKITTEMIQKYSGNQRTEEEIKNYLYTPDLEDSRSLSTPYQDNLRIVKGTYIGKNTKTLHIPKISNFSKILVSPSANIKNLIIETTDIPKNLHSLNLDLDFVKFKFLDINQLSFFKFKTDSYLFEKCLLKPGVFDEIENKYIKKLSFVSCELECDLKEFEEVNELEVVYSLPKGELLSQFIGDLKFSNLKVSGDVLELKENKKYIRDLKKSGIKVELVGLVL
jgi:hypothetical protein